MSEFTDLLENFTHALDVCRRAHENYLLLAPDASLRHVQADEFFCRAARDKLRPMLDKVSEAMFDDCAARGGTHPFPKEEETP